VLEIYSDRLCCFQNNYDIQDFAAI